MKEIKFKKIAEIIETRIFNGTYSPNSQLPPHRVLAQELATTPVTIAKAYQLLADKQLVESYVGKGTFVCGHSHLDEVIKAPDDEAEYNFSILQPCLPLNVSALQTAMQRVSQRLQSDLIGYTEYSGHEIHRQAGVEWARHYGLTGGHAQNTLLTDGAQHALSLVIEALTRPGDTIAVESLTYPGIIALAHQTGRQIVAVPSDAQGMSVQGLETVIEQAQPKLVIVIPSHQNPTGITMPKVRREQIAAVIRKAHLWLIEDDIYSFLNAAIIAPISNLVPEYAFHISSLSKAISPAMRCGYLKVPESQIAVIQSHIRTSIWLASPLNFAIASALIQSGEAFKMSENQRQLALTRQEMASQILADLEYTASGYHLWLKLPHRWSPERFVMEAKNRNIIVSSGSYFDVSNQGVEAIRLSLMAIADETRLQQGLEMIRTLILCDMNTIFPF
ncbi:PLP-dependent aminotransferase family protein [Celerinatantimonas sp. YJH-8]|uniref:aminotransferase-like domain-containing protein n=1 Tax=Celerinatantimonas sp. YJH-8 TaxID=3228714 RepID=UPI0038BF3C74